MTLKELQIGKTGIVKEVGGEGALRQHFLDMGIIPGACITVVKYAPMGDPVEVRIHGYALTLRLEDADRILIDEVLEENADASRTRIGGRRSHIHHVLHTIQALLQRNNNALLYRFGIGTGIVGTNANRWGGYLRKLFYG